MGRRVSTDTDGGEGPVPAREREAAIAWARALVATGIRVVSLRSGKAGTRRRTVEPRR